MAKIILLGLGVTMTVGLGLFVDKQSNVPRADPPPARNEASRQIFASGRVEGATEEINLRPEVQGRCAQILVKQGQSVKKGDALILLQNHEHQQQLALATAEFELAEAELKRLINGALPQERREAAALYRAKLAELQRAQLSWKRIEKLRSTQAISQQEADDQRTLVQALTAELQATRSHFEKLNAPSRVDEVEMAKARIRIAEARVQLAKVHLEQTRLLAPIDAQVLEVNIEPGELTGPTASEPALVIADTSKFCVRAFVEEMDAPAVKIDMTATVVVDGLPGVKLLGYVTRVSPRMGEKTVNSDRPGERLDTKTREIWVELDEPRELVVGLPVELLIDPIKN